MGELVQTRKAKETGWIAKLRQNPVALKELRSRMRGRRAFVVLTVYLMGVSGFISLIYLAYSSATSGPSGNDARQAGKVVFGAMVGMEVILVTFIGPSFTAGTISGEKERQTFDLLRTTLLTANSFVLGKLVSALSYVLLLIVATIPLLSIAFMLGGVSPIEVVISQLLILVAAVVFALYGLFCSSIMRSTLAASVVTFAGTLFLTIGIPVVVLLISSILGPLLFGVSSIGWVTEMTLAFAGLVLAATNLPATLILGEVFLLQENALFLFKSSFGGHSAWLFSPWPLFLLIYFFLGLFFYWATVRRVRRIANN